MTDNAPDQSVVETVQDQVADTPNPEITIDDGSPSPAPRAERDDGEPAPRREFRHEAQTRRLQEIAKQRQEERAASNPPDFHGDFRDPTQSAGNLATQPESQPPPMAADQNPPPAEARESGPSDSQGAAPKKRILKVRHGEREFTEEEIVALAQKAAAADDYLGEARRLYEHTRRQAQELNRRAAGAPHQGQPRAQATDLPHDPSQGNSPTREDPLAKAIEEVQFGADPKEAARKIRAAVADPRANQRVAAVAQQAVLNQRMTDDLAETLSAFARVKKANEDVFAEPYAEPVMEKMLHEGWREDLRSIGVPEERIPVNPQELQQWHRFYRVKGHRVRNSETLFNDVIQGYRKIRGPAAPQQQKSPQHDPARPTVAVNRSERRATIPQQPARSATPPSVPTSAQPRKSYDEVRAKMREDRKRGVPFRRAS